MKNREIKYAILFSFIAALFVACDNSEKLPPPSYQDGVWFYKSAIKSSPDKLEQEFKDQFSFYFTPEGTEEYEYELPELRVMGSIASHDRVINLEADTASTAIEGVHFRFGKVTFPANQASFRPTVILLKNALAGETFKLRVKVKPSADFPAIIAKDTTSEDRTFFFSTHFELTFSNLSQEPPYWKSLPYYFGAWGRVKYNFMYETLGVYLGLTEPQASDFDDLYNYYLTLRREIKLLPEPLIDENGNEVSF